MIVWVEHNVILVTITIAKHVQCEGGTDLVHDPICRWCASVCGASSLWWALRPQGVARRPTNESINTTHPLLIHRTNSRGRTSGTGCERTRKLPVTVGTLSDSGFALIILEVVVGFQISTPESCSSNSNSYCCDLFYRRIEARIGVHAGSLVAVLFAPWTNWS